MNVHVFTASALAHARAAIRDGAHVVAFYADGPDTVIHEIRFDARVPKAVGLQAAAGMVAGRDYIALVSILDDEPRVMAAITGPRRVDTYYLATYSADKMGAWKKSSGGN